MTAPVFSRRTRETVPRATCKICKHGIAEGQARVWLTSPMGLSRVECVPSKP